MPQLYTDLLFCSAFVTVLVAIVCVRKKFHRADRRAVDRVIFGLSLLTGFSVVQLLGHQGVFSRVLFLQEETNRKMVEAMGIVGGLIFLLTGISSLLPSLTRGRRTRQSMNKRYFCLKMINQAIGKGQDIDATYELIMNYLSLYMGLPRCAAYKYSSKKDTLILSGAIGFSKKTPQGLQLFNLSGTGMKTALHRFQAFCGYCDDVIVEKERRPDMIAPVAFENRLYGALFCWIGDAVRIDDDLFDLMTVIGQLLGKYAHAQVNKVRTEHLQLQQNAFKQVSNLCNQTSSIGEAVVELFPVMREITGAEYCSVSVLDNSGENMVSYTIGSSGRLLLEKGVSRSTRGSEIFKIYREMKPVLKTKVETESDDSEEDGLFLSCGMQSKLACPISVANRVVAVITLGHTRPGHFTPFHQHRLEAMINPLAGLVQKEHLRQVIEIKEDQMLRLQLMERELTANLPVQKVFNDACELLTKRMKSTVARISLIDNEGKNLISQACRSIRDTGRELKEAGLIPLSLLPWHRMAIDAQKAMLINQNDPESKMQPQESTSALLPDIKSAILVPIMLNDKARGIISIGEVRNWNRRSFNAGDLVFARDVAAKCSVAMRMKRLEIDVDRNRERVQQTMGLDSDWWTDFRMQLNSPLSSIVGAVEILKRREEPDEFKAKYYDMIIRSADRITGLTREQNTEADMVEEEETEQIYN